MIKGFAHVCLATADLAGAERFYCTGLGFRKAFDFLRNGERIGFYIEVVPGSYIEIFDQKGTDPDARSPLMHFCLETDDIDAVAAQLIGAGYSVTEKILGADHSWQIWTADPSGVRIEFHEYTDTSCQSTGEACVLD